MLNLLRRVCIKLLTLGKTLTEQLKLLSLDQLEIPPIVMAHCKFMHCQNKQEENTREDSECAPNTIANLTEIGRNTSTTDAISE